MTGIILAWCPRHLQSAFNLIVGIHVMVNWQLSKKGIHWPVSHDCITGSSVQLIEAACFFKVICWPGIGFNWSQAQYFRCFILMELKGHMINNINLFRSVITGKSYTSALMYWPSGRALVWDFPVMTSLLVNNISGIYWNFSTLRTFPRDQWFIAIK